MPGRSRSGPSRRVHPTARRSSLRKMGENGDRFNKSVPIFRSPFSILASLLLAALSVPVLAATPEEWRAQAYREGLAGHPEWLTLLHYENRRIGAGYRSFVDDRRFFLSDQGPTDPTAELAATLAAFFADPQAQCRFIGRRGWLVGRLEGLEGDLPPVDCDEYEEWRRILGADRVVLVFAASYLNSPSSMYGHTFLRFDSGDVEQVSPFLSYALNFGANLPADDSSLLYAWRGLAGGYPGLFAAAPYFEKLREYSRLENRDLWEYRLNLDPTEVDRLLQHLWELRDINFDYYFFDENCSLRLLELLDVARPGHDLGRQFPNYAIPVDTVRAVIDAGMVAAVDYRPANLTVLERQIGALNAEERRLARRLAADPTVAEAPAFAALEVSRRREVANIAYEYLRYDTAREARDPETASRAYALLRTVNALPAPGTAPDPPPRPTQPDEGHRTSLVAAAAGMEDHDVVADLEWRLSYHDLLDDGAGYPQGASLNTGRFVLRLKEQGTAQLQRLDVIEITSLSPRDQFFRPLSWRVNAGWDRQWTAGNDVLVTQVNAGFGGFWAVTEVLGFSVLLTGRVEHNSEFERELDIAPGVALGALWSGRRGRTLLALDRYRFTDAVDRTVWSFSQDLTLRRDLALRFGFDRRMTDSDGVSEASVAIRYYF